MLDIVRFNYNEYRFREENEELILVYNVRRGTMIFLSGEIKKFINGFSEKEFQTADLCDKRIDYLVKIGVLIEG